jgi:hypothetical protein
MAISLEMYDLLEKHVDILAQASCANHDTIGYIKQGVKPVLCYKHQNVALHRVSKTYFDIVWQSIEDAVKTQNLNDDQLDELKSYYREAVSNAVLGDAHERETLLAENPASLLPEKTDQNPNPVSNIPGLALTKEIKGRAFSRKKMLVAAEQITLTQEQALEFYSCFRKKRYVEKTDAEEFITSFHEDLSRYHSYKCDYCDKWHVGRPVVDGAPIKDHRPILLADGYRDKVKLDEFMVKLALKQNMVAA